MAKSAKERTKASAKRATRSAPTKAVRTKAKSARRKGIAAKPVVIDIHAHIVVPEVLDFAYEHSLFAQAVAGPAQAGRPAALGEEFRSRMSDMTLRLRDLDAMGVDIQVISPSILQQCTYFAEPEAAPNGSAMSGGPKRSRNIRIGSWASARCRCRTPSW